MLWWVSSQAQAQTQHQPTGLQHARQPQAQDGNANSRQVTSTGLDTAACVGRKWLLRTCCDHRGTLVSLGEAPCGHGRGPRTRRHRAWAARARAQGAPPGPSLPASASAAAIALLCRRRAASAACAQAERYKGQRWAGVREYRKSQPGIIQTCPYQTWTTPHAEITCYRARQPVNSPFRPPYGTHRASSSVKRGGHARLLRLHKAHIKPNP